MGKSISPTIFLQAPTNEDSLKTQVTEQLSNFLKELAPRIEKLPAIISISLEEEPNNLWHFVAYIDYEEEVKR